MEKTSARKGTYKMTACRPRLTAMATSSQGLRHTGTCSSELSSDRALAALLQLGGGGGGTVGDWGVGGGGVNLSREHKYGRVP